MTLLSEMSLPTTIVALLILALCIFALYVVIRRGGNKKAVNKFLSGLEETITETMIKVITSMKPDKFDTLEEYESAVLATIYDKVWDYVHKEAKLAFDSNKIAQALLDNITKETIIKFVDKIINKLDCKDTIANNYGVYSLENSNVEKEDKELEDKFADDENYFENSDKSDLIPAEVSEPSEEDIAKLNPQKDEEEKITVDDDSVEILTDEPEIITSKDKNGNTLYYEVLAGKKKRVTKAYALEHMK